MLTYKISTGDLSRNGDYLGRGYSGVPECRDDPKACKQKERGPIPSGCYHLIEVTKAGLASPVYALKPDPRTQVHGRSGFLIHGDNLIHTASHGCIILGLPIRQAIKKSKDRTLTVID